MITDESLSFKPLQIPFDLIAFEARNPLNERNRVKIINSSICFICDVGRWTKANSSKMIEDDVKVARVDTSDLSPETFEH